MGISPDYALDRMEMYEITALLEHRHLRYRESWEQARMLSFVNARCAGSKIQKPKDIFELPWDKAMAEPISEEDQQRLHAKAQMLIESGLLD